MSNFEQWLESIGHKMAEPLTTSVIMSAFAAGAAKKAGELSFSGLFSSISHVGLLKLNNEVIKSIFGSPSAL
ncbi:hypothetical protein [Bosea sp. (in: a-proteobacteria)]|uniref:hypothetical protein n=1 Tax=Bosea sp. (in: a-proteobacteria) TaxID=1871050 RepID=UPI003F713218